MKQPAWKTGLSYLTEIVLERGGSTLNPDLQLSLKKGRYCLSTPHAIYSYGDLYNNFRNAFRQIDNPQWQPREVLVLGFGLGSVPVLLEKTFGKKCRYTGVEADELIVGWASGYVLPDLTSPIQLYLADASVFVELNHEKYDLIVMDIFVDNKIPPSFETTGFLKKLNDQLNANGMIMYNRLAFSRKDTERSEIFFQQTFKAVFPTARIIKMRGNWMLLNL
ncbi:MAG TPA: hypothetical protein ENJ20_00280 [Bacteroidetes bacterium]|nr:hypothetical protein [Bacteroidota bacterium]